MLRAERRGGAPRAARGRRVDARGRPTKPRFVAGAIGPTNRTLSLSPDVNDPRFRAVTFDERARRLRRAGARPHRRRRRPAAGRDDLRHAERQGRALRDRGGAAARRASGCPLMISVTITDRSGRTLSGQTVEAFWTSIAHARPLLVGINCALGAEEMRPYLEELSRVADTFVELLPERRPAERLRRLRRDARDDGASCCASSREAGWLNLVGGCCGTTPRSHPRDRARPSRTLPPRAHPGDRASCPRFSRPRGARRSAPSRTS